MLQRNKKKKDFRHVIKVLTMSNALLGRSFKIKHRYYHTYNHIKIMFSHSRIFELLIFTEQYLSDQYYT